MDDSPPLDVLIIGGGPTGLALALTLMRSPNPPRFRIVDKAPTSAQQSRALVVQPRSLEMLQQFDIPSPALASGPGASTTNITTHMRKNGLEGLGLSVYVWAKRTVQLNMDLARFSGTQFPLPMLVSQADTETAMGDALKALGIQVERNITVRDLVRTDGLVTAVMQTPKGVEKVAARYVIGCDGAHSIVRRSAGMTFDGAAYGHEFILCDARVDWGSPEQEAANSRQLLVTIRNKLLAGIPMKDGLIRLISIRDSVPSADSHEAGQSNDNPTLQEFQKILDENIGGGAKVRDPIWLSGFRLHHRAVDRYRNARMFVAGDAAHIHSPVGGQGMNTGIQDAANLGWKLATVLRSERQDLDDENPISDEIKRRNEMLLDSYHAERQPVGLALLKSTDRMFGFMASNQWWARMLRPLWFTLVMPVIMKLSAPRDRAMRFFTQLRVRYRCSPIVGTGRGMDKKAPVRGGSRAPDGKVRRTDVAPQSPADQWFLTEAGYKGHHWLAIFASTDADPGTIFNLINATKTPFTMSNEPLDVAVVYHGEFGSLPLIEDVPKYRDVDGDVDGRLHEAWGFQKPGYALVRPDGYVAHIGLLTDMDAFIHWLSNDYPFIVRLK